MNEHVNFSLSKSGLVIDCNYPFFGASPDDVIKCRCCEFGVLEIKCPYSCRDKSFFTRYLTPDQYVFHYSLFRTDPLPSRELETNTSKFNAAALYCRI